MRLCVCACVRVCVHERVRAVRVRQLQSLLAAIEHPASVSAEVRAMRFAAVVAEVGVAQKAKVDRAPRLY
eukprot:COSAG06_NODE_67253_length_252_cov_0.875817_1_plen_69_part_01